MSITLPAMACLLAATALFAQTPNELLVVNARIFTGSSSVPWASALLSRGDRIVAVGNAEDREQEKGTLEAGKLADFAILFQDIFTVAPPELPKTTSVITVVGGRVVHEAK